MPSDIVEAVIFDLDGVIVDTAKFHFLAWKKLATSLGISFDENDNRMLKGVDRMTSLNYILTKGRMLYTEDEKLELAEQKNQIYLESVNTLTAANIIPGVLPVLRLLTQHGVAIGLASSSKNASLVIDKLGLTHVFDYVADAKKLTNNKPDPEIFLTVAKHLDVPPEHCVGIEDAISGVTALKAANMYAVGIGDKRELKMADEVWSSISQFYQRSLHRWMSTREIA